MSKESYYVNLQSQEISQVREEGENRAIKIYATPTEVKMLRKTFDRLHSAEFMTFWRAHVPIMSYHNSKSSEDYDKSLTDAVKLIYELGDENTRTYIAESGILGDRPIETPYSYPDPDHPNSEI